jgi:hypothetical protein
LFFVFSVASSAKWISSYDVLLSGFGSLEESELTDTPQGMHSVLPPMGSLMMDLPSEVLSDSRDMSSGSIR